MKRGEMLQDRERDSREAMLSERLSADQHVACLARVLADDWFARFPTLPPPDIGERLLHEATFLDTARRLAIAIDGLRYEDRQALGRWILRGKKNRQASPAGIIVRMKEPAK